jgi:3-oxoacyl-[acyl-carrier protein] reductase
MASLMNKVLEEFGTVDLMINNASILQSIPLLEIAEAQWDRLMNINLNGCKFGCKAAGKIMSTCKKGNIINIPSMGGMRGSLPQIPYGVSKAEVIQFIMAIAQELAQLSVTWPP